MTQERPLHDLIGYTITSDGRIFSSKRKNKVEISKHKHRTGYWAVSLKDDHQQLVFNVHRLIAEIFIPNPEGHKYVRFIDGDKDNLNADNLEWCSKVVQPPTRTFVPKQRVIAFDYKNDSVLVFENRSEASKHFGIATSRVTEVCGRSRKAYKGVVFSYYDELANYNLNSIDDWLDYHCVKRGKIDQPLYDWLVDKGAEQFAPHDEDVLE